MRPNEPRRIVIVDDSADDRAEIRRLLLLGSERRYRFVEAELGTAAIRAVLDGEWTDCLVLDYSLPDLDAPDVIAGLGGPDGDRRSQRREGRSRPSSARVPPA